MHVNARGLQMGRATPQSELSRHATHRPVVPKHRGAVAGQSESAAQATHDLVSGSQILLLPVQSAASLHTTHDPVGSHFGVARGQTLAALSGVQAAWHWWSPGQHEGDAAAQSELDPHAAHRPVPVMQMGVG